MTGYDRDDLEGNGLEVSECFMENHFFDESTDVICRFDIPFHPRLLSWLLQRYISIKSQTAQAISDILRPRNLQKGNLSIVIQQQYANHKVSDDCCKMDDDRREDDSLRL